ncbi:MAG: hypothetical protein CL917_06900 [Deltaproteobacteria bacterium]|nr:hypothetical protein [Deltaproteobacteria bacterium]
MHTNPKSKNPNPISEAPLELEDLGLGPDSVLMNDPKLLHERSFLGLLMAELDQELGAESSQKALFRIGACHGLRDARNVWQVPDICEGDRSSNTDRKIPHLDMRLLPDSKKQNPSEYRGLWPDHHEAHARLEKISKSERPSCFMSVGYTSGWLSGAYGRDFVVTEESCLAAGDASCSFHAVASPHQEDSKASPAPLISKVPSVESSSNTYPSPAKDAIHIWGPVMVLPCSDPTESLFTLQKLLEDNSLNEIRVILLDLKNTLMTFGATVHPIEDVFDAIGFWGPEIILTGVSPETRRNLKPANRPLLIGPNRLREAIAMAFQVAEAGLHAA